MPMHVGSLKMLDLPDGYSGDFFEDTKVYIQQRMHLAEVFTRKLALMPMDLSNPVWVEDEDRRRPLREFFVIDGLKSSQVALYSKLHHAGIDGQAGMAVAQPCSIWRPRAASSSRRAGKPAPRWRHYVQQPGQDEPGDRHRGPAAAWPI